MDDNLKEDEDEPKLYEYGAHFKYSELFSKLEELEKEQKKIEENKIKRFKIPEKNYPQSRNINPRSYFAPDDPYQNNDEQDNDIDLILKEKEMQNNTNLNNISNNNNILSMVSTKKSVGKKIGNTFLTMNKKRSKNKEEEVKVTLKNINKKPIRTNAILKLNNNNSSNKKILL